MALEDITLATLAGVAQSDAAPSMLLPAAASASALASSPRRTCTRGASLGAADAPPQLPASCGADKENVAPDAHGLGGAVKRKALVGGKPAAEVVAGNEAQHGSKRARYTTNPPSNAYERLCAATRRSSRQQALASVRADAAEPHTPTPIRASMGAATAATAHDSSRASAPARIDLLTPSPAKPAALGTIAWHGPLTPGLSSPPCSPVRRSRRRAAETDPASDSEGEDAADQAQDGAAQARRDEEALEEARQRTMARYALGGTGMAPGRCRVRGRGGFGGMRAAVLGGASSAAARTAGLELDTTASYLSTFASHLSLADYRVPPNVDHPTHAVKDWSPSYTCAYSHAGKRGDGPSLLALGTESGSVKLVDTNVNAVTEAANNAGRTFAPHKNALFDVKWSLDDSQLLTCSADMTSAVYDLKESRVVASLRGHCGSVKTGVWFSPNVVATGARDGHIWIYDLRAAGYADSGAAAAAGTRRKRGSANDGALNPVLGIRNAHTDPSKSKSRSTPKSMTCLLALKSQPNLLASSSAADGVVKLWDLRGGIQNTRKSYITEAVGETLDRSTEYGKRPRGVNWMVEGNGNIYTLGGDSRIHAHSIAQPDLALPVSYSHPNLRISTFYVKLAISPCGRYLASGSSHGGVYTWELGQNTRYNVSRAASGTLQMTDTVQAVELGWNGHAREAGAIDWGYDQLVSCSDDYTNRVWRPNRHATNLIQTNPTEAAWHWSGVQRRN